MAGSPSTGVSPEAAAFRGVGWVHRHRASTPSRRRRGSVVRGRSLDGNGAAARTSGGGSSLSGISTSISTTSARARRSGFVVYIARWQLLVASSRWRPRRRLEWLRCRRLRRRRFHRRLARWRTRARGRHRRHGCFYRRIVNRRPTRAARPPATRNRGSRRVLRRRRAPRVPRLVLVRRHRVVQESSARRFRRVVPSRRRSIVRRVRASRVASSAHVRRYVPTLRRLGRWRSLNVSPTTDVSYLSLLFSSSSPASSLRLAAAAAASDVSRPPLAVSLASIPSAISRSVSMRSISK